MKYKLNVDRPPYIVEAFQWDGTHNNWPAWTKDLGKGKHIKIVAHRLLVIQPGMVCFGDKGDYVVKYPSGSLVTMTEKNFKFNFLTLGS